MSNHFHLLVRSLSQKIDAFMCRFQSRISWEVKKIRPWRSSVFPKRYSAQPVLDRAELQQKLRYTVCNPVRHELVEHPSDWPGLNSWEFHRTGETIEGTWINYTRLGELRRAEAGSGEEIDRMAAAETCELELTPLPEFDDQGLSASFDALFRGADFELERLIDRVVDEADAAQLGRAERQELSAQRRARQQARKRILGQSPTTWSEDPARSPNPICHAQCRQCRTDYLQLHEDVMNEYVEKARRWRQGEEGLEFPPGTFPPGRLQPVPTPIPKELHQRARELGIPDSRIEEPPCD